MNVVLLTGLATDIQLKYTPQGDPILNLRIAGVRDIKRDDGDLVSVYSSHRVGLFGHNAESWANVLGDANLPQAVHAVANLRSYTVDKPDGTRRYGTNIDVRDLRLLTGEHEIREGEYGPLLVGGASRALLLGNVVRDAELRYTGGGQAVANLSIAINEWNAAKREAYTTFVSCTAWGEALATSASECTKGTPVRVAGALVLNSWQPADGSDKRYELRVNADEVLRLATPAEFARTASSKPAATPAATSARPTATRPATATTSAGRLDIDEEFPPEESLPF